MFDYRLELFDLASYKRLAVTDIYQTYSEQKHPCKIVPGDDRIVVGLKNYLVVYNKKLEKV